MLKSVVDLVNWEKRDGVMKQIKVSDTTAKELDKLRGEQLTYDQAVQVLLQAQMLIRRLGNSSVDGIKEP